MPNMAKEKHRGTLEVSGSSEIEPSISNLFEIVVQATPLGTPPTEWNQPYGGGSFDDAWSVVEAGDGGFLVVGETESYGSGLDDFYLVKTDSYGTSMWPPQTFGGSGYDRARSVARTLDGGYMVAGYTRSYGAGLDDFWMVKTDIFGNKQWSETFGGSDADRAFSVVQTSDERYAVVGYTKSFGAGNEDVCLVLIGKFGQMSWITYGGSGSDFGMCVVQTCDGGFAIGGYTNSFGAGSYDFYLIKTDQNGGLEWSQTYGGSGSDMAYSVVQTTDGGYLLAGDTTSDGAGSYDFWLVKTYEDGTEDWTTPFGGGGYDSASSVIQTYDGGYLVVGETTSYGAGQEDIWVVKTDSQGSQQWDETYGGAGSEMAGQVKQTSDGGYIIAGSTSSIGAGLGDFWLIKLTSQWSMSDLRILPRMQRKDTVMLCLDGGPYTGSHAWDVSHHGDWAHDCPHCSMYCSRAAIAMINSYCGGYLSQDRISYYYFEELHGDGLPEGDLGHGDGMPQRDALEWALGVSVDYYSGKPDFEDVRDWIDSGRPILRRHVHDGEAHATVIDGYEVTDQKVHVIDPWTGDEKSVPYLDPEFVVSEVWIPPIPKDVPSARSDEDWNDNGTPDTIEDYDADGVCDFDEIYRFFTNVDNPDSDSDGVPDKAEIISYTFLYGWSFDDDDVRKPNPDGDLDDQGRPLRCERDIDSDDGGVPDGQEDRNGNGFVDPGETDPLDPSDDPNAVHLESRQDNAASSNLGTITFDGTPYSLPNVTMTKPAETYPIQYNPALGYVFDHWEFTDGVTVADPNAQSTTATASGYGNLTAIYKAAFVHGYSMIKIHPVLGGQASMSFGILGNSISILLCFAWIFPFLKGKYRRWNKMVLVCVVVFGVLLLALGVYASLMTRVTILSSGTIKTLGLGVYWDSQCSDEALSIDWGPMLPASTNDVTLYLRNEGNIPVTLSLNTSNWNPLEASFFVALSCNYNGETIDPAVVKEVEFTLNVSESIGDTDIETFIFDINIYVHETV